VLLASALCASLATSASAAPANWLEPADLSKTGRNSTNPEVAMDAAGNTVAIWERQSTADPSINLQVSTRAVGEAFTTPADFLLKATEPRMAMTSGGEAVAIWKHFENTGVPATSGYRIQAATRPPGGSFSAPIPVFAAPPTVIPQEVQVAIGTGGDIAVTWSTMDPNAEFGKIECGIDPVTTKPFRCPNPPFVEAAVRPAGGSFTTAQRISTPRGTGPVGEDPAQKEEREKEESALAAGGARPAVDGAGNTTVVWSAFDGEDSVIQTAYRPAGGSFTAPAQVSASGGDAGLADIGVDAAGNTIASWQRNVGPDRTVQAAIKAPGGTFVPLGDVSASGASAESPVLDVSPDGTAILAWRLAGITERFVQSSTRPAGGAFSPPVSISSGKDNPLFHEVALGDGGDAIVVWSGENGGGEIARAAVRPAGSAAFGAPVAISQASGDLFHPEPSIDAGGNATVVWVRDNGTHSIVQWAGYDADPPDLRDVSIPGLATVADTVRFSASSFDVWPVGKPSFEFGDGGVADGDSVTHVYSAPGSYTVRATATDAVGKSATSSGTILVKARNYFTIGKLARNRKKGTATLTVTIPEPGAVVASGKGIRKATVRASKGGALKVPLKAAGPGLKRLKGKGKLKAKLRIAYSPVGGDTNAKPYRLTLKKKLR